jgi:hypothetical protein
MEEVEMVVVEEMAEGEASRLLSCYCSLLRILSQIKTNALHELITFKLTKTTKD